MQWNDIYVSAGAAWLGNARTSSTPSPTAATTRRSARRTTTSRCAWWGEESPADMTVAAAKKALARSGTAADDIALFLHATTSFQGLDHFTPVSYILDRAVGGTAPALEVKQACNGGMASIEVAAAYLSAMRSGPDSALVTTGDKFNLPGYDRYRSDKGMLRGDGATALVLSRRPGVARLLSTALLDDPTHEGVYRGQGEWASGSGEHGWPVNLRARTKQYLERGQTTVPELVQSITVREQETIHRALADAGITGDEVARFVFPNAGRTLVDWDSRAQAFGVTEEKALWHWGRQVGHIGAGDQAAGLVHLLETGAVSPGDKVLLFGIGGGFHFGCAVLEILEQPEWDSSTD